MVIINSKTIQARPRSKHQLAGAAGVLPIDGASGSGGFSSNLWLQDFFERIPYEKEVMVTDEEGNTTQETVTAYYLQANTGIVTLGFLSAYGINELNPGQPGGNVGLDENQLAEYLKKYGYATEGWITGKGYLTSGNMNGYATENWVTGKGYVTADNLNGYATENWVTNKGYLTTGSLTGYAKTDWVNSNFVKPDSLNAYVTIAGNESITGTKTFTTSPRFQSGLFAGKKTASNDGNPGAVLNAEGRLLLTGGGTDNVGIDVYHNGATTRTSYLLNDGTGWFTGDQNYHFAIGTRPQADYKFVALGASRFYEKVRIGNIDIIYDSANNALKIQHENGSAANLYATGGVCAYGEGIGTGGTGGGLIQTVYGYSDLQAGRVVSENLVSTYSAYATQQLYKSVVALQNAGYTTPSWVLSQGFVTTASLGNYVTLGNTQTLSGQKRFSTYLTIAASAKTSGADGVTGILGTVTGGLHLTATETPSISFYNSNSKAVTGYVYGSVHGIQINKLGVGDVANANYSIYSAGWVYSTTSIQAAGNVISGKKTASNSAENGTLITQNGTLYLGNKTNATAIYFQPAGITTTGTVIYGGSKGIQINPRVGIGDEANTNYALYVKGSTRITGVTYTDTSMYTHGKTGIRDGIGGMGVTSGYVTVTGASATDVNAYFLALRFGETTNAAYLRTSKSATGFYVWNRLGINTEPTSDHTLSVGGSTAISGSALVTGALTTNSALTAASMGVTGNGTFGNNLVVKGTIYVGAKKGGVNDGNAGAWIGYTGTSTWTGDGDVSMYYMPHNSTVYSIYVRGVKDGLQLAPRVGIGGTPVMGYSLYTHGQIYSTGSIRAATALAFGEKGSYNDGKSGGYLTSAGLLHLGNSTSGSSVGIYFYPNGVTVQNSYIYSSPAGIRFQSTGAYFGFNVAPAAGYTLRVGGNMYLSDTSNLSIYTAGGIRFGNAIMYYDSTNNAVCFMKSDGTVVNLYATGGISAYGIGSASTANITVANLTTTGMMKAGTSVSSATMSTTSTTNFAYLGVNGSNTSYRAYIVGNTFITGNTCIGGTNTAYRLYVSGTLHVTGNITSGGTISDKRLKDNLKEVESPIALLKGIGPLYHYRYNDQAKQLCPTLETEDYGLLYQNVYTALPGYTGKLENSDYGTVKYDRFIPLMLASILEAYDKYESLVQRIERLEKENNELKMKLKYD